MTMERRGMTRRTRLVEALVSPDSYGLVLVLIATSYVLAVLQGTSPLLGSVVVLVQIATVWFVLRTARAGRAVRATAFVILVVSAIVAVTGGLIGGEVSALMVLLASAALYFIAPIVVVRHLVGRSVVDREAVLGVIAAYLLIGMFFAFVYRIVELIGPDPFFGAGGIATPSQALFFSFTTLSTTGYGNLIPAASIGQTLAVAEMIIGQLFLITAVGKVISAWSPIGKASGDAPTSREGTRSS
jgi:hypothetical protein